MLNFLFGTKGNFDRVTNQVDKAMGVFTKTVNKLNKANDELDKIHTKAEDKIAHHNSKVEHHANVQNSVKAQKERNSKMIKKIESFME